MAESLLWNLIVVDSGVLQQGLFEFCPTLEAGGLDDFGDAPIEAFHHTVGLGASGWNEAVLHQMLAASLIEQVPPCRFSFPGGTETIGELFAIIREGLGDFEGGFVDQAIEESGSDLGFLGVMDFEIDPAGSPVDGGEQVTSLGFVGHLGKVFDINVDESWFIILESLLGLGGRLLAFLGRDQGLEVGDAMAAQTAIQRRPGQLGADELTGDSQQIIQGQQEGFTQAHDNGFLGGCQGGMEPVGTMGSVFHGIPVAPFTDGVAMNSVDPGQFSGRQIRGLDFPADLRAGAGFLVQSNDHVVSSTTEHLNRLQGDLPQSLSSDCRERPWPGTKDNSFGEYNHTGPNT